MRIGFFIVAALAVTDTSGWAELKSGPPLPHKVVKNWAKLPAGWNFGECAGVAVDKDDNVWVYNRGKHPVIHRTPKNNHGGAINPPAKENGPALIIPERPLTIELLPEKKK